MIISFCSAKGGVGKTVSCVNLAYALSQKKKKVLLIDLDCQAAATHHLSEKFDKSFSYSIDQALAGECKAKDAIHTYNKYLDFTPVSFELSNLFDDSFEGRMKKFISKVEKDYDFIFFDLSPSVFIGTNIPLSLSRWAIIPIDLPGGLGLLGMKTAIQQIINIANTKNENIDLLGILPCFMDRTIVSKEVFAHLKEEYTDLVFSPIRKNTSVAQSASIGKTIFEHKKDSHGAKDYTKLAKEFLKRIKEL